MASSSLSSRGRPSWIVIVLLITSIALGYLYYSVSLSKTKLQAELLSLREAKSLSDHALAHIRERVELSRKEYRSTTEKYERERVDAQRSRQASEAELKSKLSLAIGEVEEKSSQIAQLTDTLELHVDLIADLRIRNTTLSRRNEMLEEELKTAQKRYTEIKEELNERNVFVQDITQEKVRITQMLRDIKGKCQTAVEQLNECHKQMEENLKNAVNKETDISNPVDAKDTGEKKDEPTKEKREEVENTGDETVEHENDKTGNEEADSLEAQIDALTQTEENEASKLDLENKLIKEEAEKVASEEVIDETMKENAKVEEQEAEKKEIEEIKMEKEEEKKQLEDAETEDDALERLEKDIDDDGTQEEGEFKEDQGYEEEEEENDADKEEEEEEETLYEDDDKDKEENEDENEDEDEGDEDNEEEQL